MHEFIRYVIASTSVSSLDQRLETTIVSVGIAGAIESIVEGSLDGAKCLYE